MKTRRFLCLMALTMAVSAIYSLQLTPKKDCDSQQPVMSAQTKQTTPNPEAPKVFTVVYATSNDGFLNVRKRPTMRSPVLTKLYQLYHGIGNGVLRENGDKWSKISVGTITGWVYKKHLGYLTWYDGKGTKPTLIAARDNMPIYGENFADEGDLPLFTTVPKGTIIADNYEEDETYYMLTTAHDFFFIKKGDVILQR